MEVVWTEDAVDDMVGRSSGEDGIDPALDDPTKVVDINVNVVDINVNVVDINVEWEDGVDHFREEETGQVEME